MILSRENVARRPSDLGAESCKSFYENSSLNGWVRLMSAISNHWGEVFVFEG